MIGQRLLATYVVDLLRIGVTDNPGGVTGWQRIGNLARLYYFRP